MCTVILATDWEPGLHREKLATNSTLSGSQMAENDDARQPLQLDGATLEAIIDVMAAKLRQGSAVSGSNPGTSKDIGKYDLHPWGAEPITDCLCRSFEGAEALNAVGS